MNHNTILLRRRNRLIVPRGSGSLPVSHTAAFNKNLEALGYTLSPAALDAIATLDARVAALLHHEVVTTLKELRGVHDFVPMYPNFPGQVMDASAASLYLNALRHYLSVWVSDIVGDERRPFVWLPAYEKEARKPLHDAVTLTVLDLGTEDDLRQIFEGMVASKTSISAADRTELAWYLEHCGLTLPDVIPNKEVLATVGAVMLSSSELRRHVKTATDVLRIAVAMSAGDVSLAEPTRFRSFTRRERRALLGLLENCSNAIEDMLRWKGRWIRLGERLHPGELRKMFPGAAESFDTLRRGLPVETFGSRVERAMRSGNTAEAIDLLRDRPGELARRLDHLLRIDPSPSVISEFGEVAHGVSTPVLLQLLTHFRERATPRDLRIFFPKGNVAKVAAVGFNLQPIPEAISDAAAHACEGALVDRFSSRPALGRVFIDDRLRDYLVPFSQRSASRSLRTLVRGSRVSLPDYGDTVRFFLWWREGEVGGRHTRRVDIDLSAVLYDARWRYKEHVSYTNLRSSTYRACHSGDITSAPNGACEYIDLDVPSVLAHGGRFVVMSVNSFTGQAFTRIPECRAGWMMREHPGSGEIFEPATVQDRVDIASDTKICIPVILDLLDRKAVWADLALRRHPQFANNVEGNFARMTLIGKAITEVVKPDLFSLFSLHAEARGHRVSHEKDADAVFSLERGITPYDLETIASEYL